MPSIRSKRVAQLIRQELAGSVLGKLSDPRISGIGVTDVEMSGDLKQAFVYYSCPRQEKERVQAGLERASGFIKRELSPKLALKFIPDLVFRHDPSIDQGEHIDQVLSSIEDNSGRES
jgi:ribosome-binding factor A